MKRALCLLGVILAIFAIGFSVTQAAGPAYPYAVGGTGSSTVPAVGQVFYAGNTAWQSVATSSISAGTGVTFAGTPGYLIGGTNLTISASGSGTVSTSSSETATFVPFWTSTNGTPALLSGGSANFTWVNATSILSVLHLLSTGSTTLQNFTALNATTSQATTTNLATTILCVSGDCRSAWPTNAVSSVFGRTGAVVAQSGDYTTAQVTESGNLYYTDARARAALSSANLFLNYNNTTGVFTASTTPTFTFSTSTQATSTNFFATTASTTNFFGAGLPGAGCSGTTFLQWSAGLFACGTPSGGGGTFPFTTTTFGATTANATSTLIGFTAGLYSLASSTIGGGTLTSGLTIAGGATSTDNFNQIPANPSLASSTQAIDLSYQVAVQGNYMYAAENGAGLRIYDIRNPSSPTVVGSYTGISGAVSIVVAGRYAYIGDQTTGINIIDISNPNKPVLIGQQSFLGTRFGVTSYQIALSGKYLYVPDYNNSALRVVDISDPTNPVVVSSVSIANGSGATYSVVVQGKYAYVGDQGSAKVYIYDISKPTALLLIGSYTTSGLVPQLMRISGRYLFETDAQKGLSIIDVSNPVTPVRVAQYKPDTTDDYTDVSVANNYAYVTDENNLKLLVLDVTSPSTTPTLVSSITFSSGVPFGVTLAGKYAYVPSYNGGIKVVELTGARLPAANIGALQAEQLNVSDDLQVGNNGYFGGSLNLGIGGLFSRGTISAYVSSSTEVNPVVANFMGGAVGIGTTSPYSLFTINATPSTINTSNILFAISSSTAAFSTSTLFAVNNVGSTSISLLGACNSSSNALQTDATGLIKCGSLTGTTYTGTWPIGVSGTVISWLGLATTSNPTAGNLFYSNGTNGLVPVATSSPTNGTGITLSGTGSVVGGSLSITNSSPLSGLTTSFPLSFSNPTLSWIGLATTSNLVSSHVVYSTGVNTIADVATSSIASGSGITVTNGSTAYVIGAQPSIACNTANTSTFGCLTSTDWNTFNGKQAAGNYITALTGDVTASGPGSAATTLATVNASPGTYTYASLTVNGKGLVTSASNGVTPATFTYLFPNLINTANNNATSSIVGFTGGLDSYATSTIGSGTQIGGLTISGGATTTLNAYFASSLGIGSTTPGSLLSVGNTGGINFVPTATSTFGSSANGLNITNGCFAIGGVCLTAGAIGGGSTAAANWATTGVLAGTPTYSNGTAGVGGTLTEAGTGALSVDSNNPAVGDRVLVKNQASAFQNGIYSVTAAGSGIASYILTRATDYNSPTEITPGINTYVLSGTVNADSTWAVSFTPPLVIGTNSLTYAESAAGGTVTSVAASVPAFLSISGSPVTTSGTLAISYSGTALPIANGGTNATSFGTSGGITAYDGTRLVNFSGYTLNSSLLTATNATTTALTVGSYFNLISGGVFGIASSSPWGVVGIGTGTASTSVTIAEYAYSHGSNEATSTTKTLDFRTANQIAWPDGTSATTLTLDKAVPGSKDIVVVQTPNSGTPGVVTWAAASGYTLIWAGGTKPTMSTTNNTMDVCSFLATQGSSTIALIGACTVGAK